MGTTPPAATLQPKKPYPSRPGPHPRPAGERAAPLAVVHRTLARRFHAKAEVTIRLAGVDCHPAGAAGAGDEPLADVRAVDASAPDRIERVVRPEDSRPIDRNLNRGAGSGNELPADMRAVDARA